LDWDNPQKAMKENLNVLISMGIGILYVFVVGFLVYKMLMSGFNILTIYGTIGLIFIVSSYGLYIPLKNLIKKQFEILE
jgi:ABC-2 type transport system permease protein